MYKSKVQIMKKKKRETMNERMNTAMIKTIKYHKFTLKITQKQIII